MPKLWDLKVSLTGFGKELTVVVTSTGILSDFGMFIAAGIS
jgi:hypothetical protein